MVMVMVKQLLAALQRNDHASILAFAGVAKRQARAAIKRRTSFANARPAK
jgi:hypothetical protein